MARVLYVEDHADTREAVSRMLQLSGYDVDTANSGREALIMAIGRTPDVILLDLALPEMNGDELLQVLHSYHRLATIPVVVLTAMHTGEIVERTKTLNVSAFLIKTISTFDHIHTALQEAIIPRPGAELRAHQPEKWRSDRISPL
jgi:CheY-like chemotaxis protein